MKINLRGCKRYSGFVLTSAKYVNKSIFARKICADALCKNSIFALQFTLPAAEVITRPIYSNRLDVLYFDNALLFQASRAVLKSLVKLPPPEKKKIFLFF